MAGTSLISPLRFCLEFLEHWQPTTDSRFSHTVTRERRSSIGLPQVIKFTTFNNYGYSWGEKNKVWIPLAEKEQLRERNYASFRSIKKTTETGIKASFSYPAEDGSEDNESYDLSAKDEPSSVPMDAFQAEIRTAFRQLRISQDIHGGTAGGDSGVNSLSNPHIEDNVILSFNGVCSLLFFNLLTSQYIKPEFVELMLFGTYSC
ncbi:hypothetical protein M9H77_17557 [Catharanthus roseus]|uniref:Uncharacterized protein n=1 Tax=Catharanthus roseus TaxID=4058 RepID=A0ACC0B503_CATRO|nr:hypothetical protein M9H77_17557 [Catharanthus roseus]